jgi:hypothetical protein
MNPQSTKSSPLFRPLACISLASASALAFMIKTLKEKKKEGKSQPPVIVLNLICEGGLG